MKKIDKEAFVVLLISILGIALSVLGSVLFVAHFFVPALPIFNSLVYLSLGILMLLVVKLYFMFIAVVDTMARAIKAINEQKASSPFLSGLSDNVIVKEIKIDEHSTPEEIEKIKRDFPTLSGDIEKMLSSLAGGESKTSGGSTLEQQLNKAVEESNFEKAAELRDKINKSKK